MPWHNIASGLRFDVRFDSRHLLYNCFQVCWVSHAGASCDSFRVSMQRLLNARSAVRSLRYLKRVSRPISNRSYRSCTEFIAILPSLLSMEIHVYILYIYTYIYILTYTHCILFDLFSHVFTCVFIHMYL